MIRMTLGLDGKLSDKQIIEAMNHADPIIAENIQYYTGANPKELAEFNQRELKGAQPNNYLQSAYAATLVDCAVGYCGSEITYSDNIKDDEDATDTMDALTPIHYYNNNDVLSMKVFTQQLAAGVSYKIHWVDKTEGNRYMMDTLDPMTCWPVYDYELGSNLIAFIYKSESGIKDEQKISVYYNDFTDTFQYKDTKLNFIKSMPNDYAPNIPVAIYYNSFNKGEIVSLFQNVKTLINAKDCILRGNWNEIDKGIQAILLHYAEIKAEDIHDMKERQNWQVGLEDLQNMRYLMKTIQWEYQKFFNDVITQEIHKAAHIVDFYNPETGVGTPQSGKALRYRLIDMDTRCKMFEMFNRSGEYQSLKLLQNINAIPAGSLNMITVNYKHNIPEDFYENLDAYNRDTLLSKRTKYEMLGLDPEVEQARLDDEKEESVDGILNGMEKPAFESDPADMGEDKQDEQVENAD